MPAVSRRRVRKAGPSPSAISQEERIVEAVRAIESRPLIVVGIDPGLSCLGVCLMWFDGTMIMPSFLEEADGMRGKNPWDRGQGMALRVLSRIMAQVRPGPTRVFVFIEDAAYNARYHSESVAHVRQAIYESLYGREPIALIEPIGIGYAKRAATGNFRASKAEVKDAVFQKYGAGLYECGIKARTEAMADATAIALGGISKVNDSIVNVGARKEAAGQG